MSIKFQVRNVNKDESSIESVNLCEVKFCDRLTFRELVTSTTNFRILDASFVKKSIGAVNKIE